MIRVRGLSKSFSVRRGLLRSVRGQIHAVRDVSFEIRPGECLALVGESGSGKTTLGRCLLRLIEPNAGEVEIDGLSVLQLPPAELRASRRDFQMVFQDPFGSLNPRMSVGRILAEPLAVHGIAEKRRRPREVERLLDMVGLSRDAARRYPHEFSGGQRQRIGIARALASRPKFLVADEPVSSLDVSVQAQIINLLSDLQKEFGLALLFIAHDLAIVEHIADRVAVLYLGRIVEMGPTAEVLSAPQHPYTVSLLSAVPVPQPGRNPERIVLEGEMPSAMDPPTGCAFHPRCPIAEDRCQRETPNLGPGEKGERRVACHFSGQLRLPGRGESH